MDKNKKTDPKPDLLKYEVGDVVMHKLTTEWVMILERVEDQEVPGYRVRLSSDYSVLPVAHFEVDKPKQ